jgi:hypothetical protein
VRIAIVAPSTSKGVPLPEWWDSNDGADASSRNTSRLDQTLLSMPLYGALLKSLYATCESGFSYTVYVAANADDPILGDLEHVAKLFALAADAFAGPNNDYNANHNSGSGGRDGLGDFPEKQRCEAIGFRLLLLPATLVPTTSLSALFNLPTLAAVAAGDEYVYLANDDLVLVSDQWSSRFVAALQQSQLWPNVGVAGGVDTSDTATPQIEFPFFHKTHVALFKWCGATPWAFRNWFEDNWLTDIYAPFAGAVHYLKDVEVLKESGSSQTSHCARARDSFKNWAFGTLT